MAVTVQDVLNLALVLIDEVSESGAIQSETPQYYESKAIALLTIVQAELLPASISPPMLTALTDELIISDKLALQVASYGLAAKIALSEDQNLSFTLNSMYDEYKKKIPTTAESIIDMYTGGQEQWPT